MDQTNDSIFPEASHVNGTSEVGTTGSTGVTGAPPSDRTTEGVAAGLRPGFLAELAVAMRATAEKERERIAARVADDAAAHVDKVRARAAIETDELKRLAEEDVQHIEEWSASEIERIRSEANQKIEDRRASLEEYLKQHDSIIDTEIDGVNAAVREYSATLDRYFEDLSKSEDPATIVARAEALPPAPDLDQVRAQARARAVAVFAEAEETSAASASAGADETSLDAAAIADAGADTPDAATEAPRSEMANATIVPEATVGAIVSETTSTDQNAPAEGIMTSEVDGIGEAAMTSGDESTAPADMSVADQPPMEASGSSETEPIPVMDPVATAESGWPAPETGTEPEPEPVAASVDHTSAAVRLLRSVAPWTAPTHAGVNDRSESE
ncbi:MAG TPA: hypothetical protein VFM38_14285 [Candidatus Limnocylindrales bacterium]|nr:hypothetical protein [Candidatus Limnocylindrales bacterium]